MEEPPDSNGTLERLYIQQIMQLIPLPQAAPQLSNRMGGLQLAFAGLRQGAAQGTAAQLGGPAMKAVERS
jgi:hypothetical protein